MAARAAAPVHQVAAWLCGDGLLWAGQSDEALLAQGNASRLAGPMMVQQGLSWMSGLEEAFATSGSRMLDVGTGVAALAVSFAEQLCSHAYWLSQPKPWPRALPTIASSSDNRT
jgi:hypothetical protein